MVRNQLLYDPCASKKQAAGYGVTVTCQLFMEYGTQCGLVRGMFSCYHETKCGD